MSLILNGTTGLSDVDGSAATPAIRGTDANTGMFFPAADTIAFAEGGVEAMRINSDSQLVTTAGSASLPAITTTGDTNTGMFFPAADTIAFATAGTEDFRIGSAGQLGIQGANYGTSGQVLTSGGSGAAPTWSTPSSGGVTSLTAGNGITVSASTGAVTVSQDIYTGSTVANATYPVGTNVVVFDGNSAGPYAVNSTFTVWSPGANTARFSNASTGSGSVTLTGTWRVRGNNTTSADGYLLMQRTA
jgi:hypothetical protein